MNVFIKDFPAQTKPRERMIAQGVNSLSDTELLAIVIRSGSNDSSALDLANEILSEFNGFTGLIETGIPRLLSYKGIGLAKATSIKACVEIALRIKENKESESKTISSPQDIHKTLRKEMYAKEQELFYLVCLDGRNRLISKELVSAGTVNETLAHPREVFRKALLNNAVSVILAHNHPSGDTSPSEEDIKVTKRLIKVGVELGVPVIDHIIIYNDTFTSLKSINLLESDNKLIRKEVNK